MKRSPLAYFLGAFCIVVVSSALVQTPEQLVHNIMLAEPTDIADAASVNHALTVLVSPPACGRVEIFPAGTRSHGQNLPRWPLPPVRPKRAAYDVEGLPIRWSRP